MLTHYANLNLVASSVALCMSAIICIAMSCTLAYVAYGHGVFSEDCVHLAATKRADYLPHEADDKGDTESETESESVSLPVSGGHCLV